MLTQVHYTDVAQARQDKASEIDLTVIVKAIQNFSDYSGVMDKTDPFVEICLGTQMRRTSVKPNAGGDVTFDQELAFVKRRSEPLLTVRVCDSNSIGRDKCLGEGTIDLHSLKTLNTNRSTSVDVLSKYFDPKLKQFQYAMRGQVLLSFRSAPRNVTVHSSSVDAVTGTRVAVSAWKQASRSSRTRATKTTGTGQEQDQLTAFVDAHNARASLTLPERGLEAFTAHLDHSSVPSAAELRDLDGIKVSLKKGHYTSKDKAKGEYQDVEAAVRERARIMRETDKLRAAVVKNHNIEPLIASGANVTVVCHQLGLFQSHGVNACDAAGRTPLVQAFLDFPVSHSRVRLLLHADADVNACDPASRVTALHRCMSCVC